MKHLHLLTLGLAVASTLTLSSTSHAQVKLSWKDNSANETRFVIERATSAGGPWQYCGNVAGNTTNFVDNYAAAGVTYYYRVKAQNNTWTSLYTNVASKACPAAVVGSGTGLTGQYFKDSALSTLVKTQVDPQVNFNWGIGSPGTSIGTDNFSVRWSGQVLTQEGGTYSFSTSTDDGVRLWVDGTLVVDKWTTSGTFSANVTLAANTKVSLKMEYRELTGSASAQLKWTKPGASAPILIPKPQLFPQ